mmetsp:Transcript_51401/g.88470  ORF Transcript_51401/g.88470 Transcript_51401/m.88470 type:complete len:158 (-) Transcript_51401:239-712(-)
MKKANHGGARLVFLLVIGLCLLTELLGFGIAQSSRMRGMRRDFLSSPGGKSYQGQSLCGLCRLNMSSPKGGHLTSSEIAALDLKIKKENDRLISFRVASKNRKLVKAAKEAQMETVDIDAAKQKLLKKKNDMLTREEALSKSLEELEKLEQSMAGKK